MTHRLPAGQQVDFPGERCICGIGSRQDFAGSGLRGIVGWDSSRRVAAWTLNPRLTRFFQVAICPMAAKPESI
jgi:hypothetical protein